MNKLWLVISVGYLCSCASTHETIFSETDAVYSQCMEKVRSGEIKNYVGEAECVNKGLEQLVVKYDYPYWDLFFLQASYRNDVARKLDDGSLTPQEAKQIMDDVDVMVSEQEVERIALVNQVQSEDRQRMQDMIDIINQMEATAAGKNRELIQ